LHGHAAARVANLRNAGTAGALLDGLLLPVRPAQRDGKPLWTSLRVRAAQPVMPASLRAAATSGMLLVSSVNCARSVRCAGPA